MTHSPIVCVDCKRAIGIDVHSAAYGDREESIQRGYDVYRCGDCNDKELRRLSTRAKHEAADAVY